MKRLLSLLLLLALSLPAAAPSALAGGASAALTEAAESFVDRLAQGDYKRAAEPFDANMRGAAPPDKLREIWFDLIKQTGPFQERTGSRVEAAGAYAFVFVTCRFERSSLDVKVVFDAESRIAGMFFTEALSEWHAPAYATAGAFTEEEVTVGAGQWELPGTLTVPWGDGPFPAVLLVHGSGPNDRDETIGPNKPFKDLAWGLASAGVAVLRYEKRTRQHALKITGSSISVTVEQEVIADALAGLALLRGQRDVDAERVFLLGHSLGGYLAPRIAQRDSSLAGMILLAGSARPLEDLILEQVAYIVNLDGVIDAEEASLLATTRMQVNTVKSYALGPDTPREELPFGVPAPYWLDLRGYDPVGTAARLGLPTLILQGGRDYQVREADFTLWGEALGERENVSRLYYRDLDHLFMIGEGMGRPEDYQRTGHVDPRVIRDLAGWMTGF